MVPLELLKAKITPIIIAFEVTIEIPGVGVTCIPDVLAKVVGVMTVGVLTIPVVEDITELENKEETTSTVKVETTVLVIDGELVGRTSMVLDKISLLPMVSIIDVTKVI